MTIHQMTIQEIYNNNCNTPSDINEHLPRLMTMASLCDKVVELGVRGGVSTSALLAGLDQRVKFGPRSNRELFSYDLNDCSNQTLGNSLKGTQVEWIFTCGDSRSIVIPECEMLFIDTLHTARQLSAELEQHHENVSRWIVLHDTETFGQHGEDGEPGLMHALLDFLAKPSSGSNWRLINLLTNNNGLAVIERRL